ncbi:MAG: (4Fe-4S)-binding protein, partial [Bacteroidetes bacterium]|nr:(4Fe-4S)-binding protein [Bacteroidota bacterium]
CIHSTKCWKELSAVFKPQERTWIHPDAADAATVRAQVLRCPSGALSLPPEDEAAAINADPQVEVTSNGPLLVKGPVQVKHPDGRIERKEGSCALCRCGGSANKPYCDGSHKRNGFQG